MTSLGTKLLYLISFHNYYSFWLIVLCSYYSRWLLFAGDFYILFEKRMDINNGCIRYVRAIQWRLLDTVIHTYPQTQL